MSFRKLLRKPMYIIYGVGVVLLLVAGGLWWEKVSTDPARVFWSTLDQSLSTNGVTVTATQTNATTSAKQIVQYSLGVNKSTTLTTLVQGNTTVVDETYGTPSSDYTRYLSVNTDQRSASGKKLDFSTILGQWAKSDNTSASASSVVILAQSVLGTSLPLGGVAMPIGSLTPKLRSELVSQIRNQDVYQTTFSKVEKTHQDGRLLYTYNVEVQPILYASMMKSFGKVVGLHNFDSLDPNSFSGQPNLDMTMTIDVRAHHLVSVSAANGEVNQAYSAYDVPVSAPLPSHTITATELQNRLTQLQK